MNAHNCYKWQHRGARVTEHFKAGGDQGQLLRADEWEDWGTVEIKWPRSTIIRNRWSQDWYDSPQGNRRDEAIVRHWIPGES